jgi:hypothetical protein
VMATAGWSLSRRPEDYPGQNADNYLNAHGLAGCGAFGVASCVGYSPGGGGWALEAGLGAPGFSGTYGYGVDWNSVVGGMWNAMPVEDPDAAMPSNGAWESVLGWFTTHAWTGWTATKESGRSNAEARGGA